jgi:pyridoxal phosphate enzyme (YggS family)
LADRLSALEERLAAACRRAGREREEVTLVCVTKTIGPELAALLPDLGVFDLGENRPQELWRKAALLPTAIRWHLIGHLQRNKIERTFPLVARIHSVDSLRLLTALEDEAGRLGRRLSVFLEVNASREVNKQGFSPDAVSQVLPHLGSLRHIEVTGLMTMAALDANLDRARATFAELRGLRDRLRGEVPPPHRLEDLSMGMTQDFEVAIEEGATLVRIGSALFEGLEKDRG